MSGSEHPASVAALAKLAQESLSSGVTSEDDVCVFLSGYWPIFSKCIFTLRMLIFSFFLLLGLFQRQGY